MKPGSPPGPRKRGRPERGDAPRSGPAAGTARAAPPRAALPPGMVLLGEFGRAHGLKGEVRLKSYTADPLAIAGYSPLTGGDGRSYAIQSVRQAAGDQPDMLVARVAGVSDRTGAEALNRVALHVARDRLATETEEDEFLLADLIGLVAETEDGAVLGTVTTVPNFGGGDLIEILPSGGRQSVLVPFTRACVPRIDIAGGKLVVTAPDLFTDAARPEVMVLGEPDTPPDTAP
jgi:16S rRNA processing protein RimM